MEQPPDNSDCIQLQELSSPCNLPNGFDLTQNGEECLLKVNSIEALHAVQPPSWYLSSGTGNGMLLPENGLDLSQRPSDQIQPDNAPSNTTVTLSYVTRSHVLSAHEPLSQHSQIYSIPISKAFSLHPSLYDATQLVTDAASLCVDIDQPCLQQVSVPVGIASCANPFDFAAPALVENVTSLYFQQAPNLTGIQNVENLSLEMLQSLQQNNPTECKSPLNLDEIQNGGISSLWNAGSFNGSFPASQIENTVHQNKNGNPELLFLISRAEDPAILQNDQGPVGLTVPLNQEFISALEGSAVPSIASVDGVDDVSVVPSISVSPSKEAIFVQETSKAEEQEISNGENEPLVNGEEKGSLSVADVSFSTSTKPTRITVESLTEQSGQCSNLPEVQKSERNRHKVTNKRVNLQGCLLAKNETLIRKELPPRTTRGMRLEAIVQNIYPTRYKSNNFSSPLQKSVPPNTVVSQTCEPTIQRPDASLDKTHKNFQAEVCPKKARIKPNTTASQLQEKEEETDVVDLNSLATSCSNSVSNHSLAHTFSRKLHQPITHVKKSKKQNLLEKSRVRVEKQTALSPQKSSTNRTLSTLSKGSPKAKKVHTPKRKRKKHKMGQASIFLPKEPEIKLKYLTCNQEKREKRDETFSPFVRVDLNASPTCMLVNYPEESARLRRGMRQTLAVSGKLPTSSYLQFGRVSMEGTRQAPLVCCLCGGAANAMDLGDLHGPYYSKGFRPKQRKETFPQESREEDSSDTDSSHVAAPLSAIRTLKPHSKLQAAALGTYQRWTNNGDLSCSPVPKRPRMDGITNWYTPPVVPLEASEYWFHEDCGIWSAGVFLVRGKLYGLEKAVKMAKETLCCLCHKTGASLGCFFKGCSNKYHYICAMQSDCVLNEENFSMKCKKHKDLNHLLFSCKSAMLGDQRHLTGNSSLE